MEKIMNQYAGKLESGVDATKKKFKQGGNAEDFVNQYMKQQTELYRANYFLGKLSKQQFEYSQ